MQSAGKKKKNTRGVKIDESRSSSTVEEMRRSRKIFSWLRRSSSGQALKVVPGGKQSSMPKASWRRHTAGTAPAQQRGGPGHLIFSLHPNGRMKDEQEQEHGSLRGGHNPVLCSLSINGLNTKSASSNSPIFYTSQSPPTMQ